MKILRFFSGIVLSFSLIFIALISSVEIAAYSDFSFYEKEYNKYAVTSSVDISMPELMNVTKDMMAYLKGDREKLSDIKATIGGIPDTPFFNEREVLHMEDVRGLFIGAVYLRYILVFISIICIIFAKISRGRISHFFSNVLIYGTLITLAFTGILVFLIAGDFEKYFIIFHHIFFNNDLWMLDPATDNLINIVPQGFFMDMSKRIVIIFSAFILLMIGSGVVLKKIFK